MEKHIHYVIEDEFEYLGYNCVVVFIDHGWRCGYVGIPEDSPIAKDYTTEMFWGLNVHGGLTFGRTCTDTNKYPSSTHTNLYYLGFDCGHFLDGQDMDTLHDYFPNCNTPFYATGRIWSFDDVRDEVKNLAEELKELEDGNK